MLLKCTKAVHTVDQFVTFNNNNVVGRRSREVGNRRTFYSNDDYYPSMKKLFSQFIECCKYLTWLGHCAGFSGSSLALFWFTWFVH